MTDADPKDWILTLLGFIPDHQLGLRDWYGLFEPVVMGMFLPVHTVAVD